VRLNRILVPVDFSRHSLAALNYASDLAREHGSEVILVHVIEPLPYSVGRWTEASRLLEQRQEEAARELAGVEKHAVSKYPNCRGEIHFGDVHQVISNLVRKLHIDLIVVSTHGRTGLGHMVMGSVAEKIVRYAPCPVLTLKAKLRPRKHRSVSNTRLPIEGRARQRASE
jgi:universal stress protein A